MVDVAGHQEKLKQAKAEYKRASGYRRRDLGKYIQRLQKELSECSAHLSGTYGKAKA
ncbi:MAG: hypothetical protein VB061_08400 [Christensenella sp.]|nr:hypothetical protein [Christensenella sp.]